MVYSKQIGPRRLKEPDCLLVYVVSDSNYSSRNCVLHSIFLWTPFCNSLLRIQEITQNKISCFFCYSLYLMPLLISKFLTCLCIIASSQLAFIFYFLTFLIGVKKEMYIRFYYVLNLCLSPASTQQFILLIRLISDHDSRFVNW